MASAYKGETMRFIKLLIILAIVLLVIVGIAALYPELMPSTTDHTYQVPDPIEIERMNEEHCQLEVGTDNTISIYCEGE